MSANDNIASEKNFMMRSINALLNIRNFACNTLI